MAHCIQEASFPGMKPTQGANAPVLLHCSPRCLWAALGKAGLFGPGVGADTAPALEGVMMALSKAENLSLQEVG